MSHILRLQVDIKFGGTLFHPVEVTSLSAPPPTYHISVYVSCVCQLECAVLVRGETGSIGIHLLTSGFACF